MIHPEKRKAIYLLHVEGMGVRHIARQLNISRNSVRDIIEHKGCMPEVKRKDKIKVDEQLLRRLYQQCDGWMQRVHEKLGEEHGIRIGYSTLTRLIGELEIGKAHDQRCGQVADRPGAEMQHDTSEYRVKFAGEGVRVVGSMLYFRYSKCRYVKFYRSFNRFNMKCFLHEALIFYGYAAPVCIIDNTNLARLRGSGKHAVIVPEMEKFAVQYGFAFVCHEINHSNRKAGNERSFFTVETNFLPGRSFENLEDLNAQGLDWATKRLANRPVSKTGLIPASAFEYEKPFLKKVAGFIPEPYLVHKRQTDQYGYVSFEANFYWVPGTSRVEVTVLQYHDRMTLYHARKLLVEYALPPQGIKNERFWPPDITRPAYEPKDRKKPTAHEEQTLRATAGVVAEYLQFAIKAGGKPKHRFIRELYSLHRKLAPDLFITTIQRALTYRISDIATLERIAILLMRTDSHELTFLEIDSEFQNREAYLEGRFTDEVDLSAYEKMLPDDENKENG
jgi:transposase